jgi:FkbM family methyltransferase
MNTRHIFLLSFLVIQGSITVCEQPYIKFIVPEDGLGIIASYLPKNPIILEAGAFDGAHSELLGQSWPKGTIYAFEPAPDRYLELVKRIKCKRNIYPYPFALSDKAGLATFYLSHNDYDLSHTSMSSSLLPPKEHLAYAPEVLFDKQIQVFCTTIDEWAEAIGLDHVDFMWLDMQGGELAALKSSPKILKTVKVISTEVESVEAYEGQPLLYEVKSWLESQGFTMIAGTVDFKKTPNWFADLLFVRK